MTACCGCCVVTDLPVGLFFPFIVLALAHQIVGAIMVAWEPRYVAAWTCLPPSKSSSVHRCPFHDSGSFGATASPVLWSPVSSLWYLQVVHDRPGAGWVSGFSAKDGTLNRRCVWHGLVAIILGTRLHKRAAAAISASSAASAAGAVPPIGSAKTR